MLESQGVLADARVADLYAGSGSFGIEALSRGAASAVFVERSRAAAEVLRENIERLGFADRAEVIVASVESALARIGPVDLAFCDPPYADGPWDGLLARLEAEIVVGHAETPIALGERWEELRRRSYGRSQILIARRAVNDGNSANQESMNP